MFVELRKLKSCIRTWENEEKRKRAKGGVAQVQLQGVPHVQCPMRRPAQVTPHLRYSNKLDISLPAPCSTRYSDCSYVRYLFIPRRISSRCTLCCNRYRSGVQCCTAGGGGVGVSRYWAEVKSEWISDPGLLVALSSLVCVCSSPISLFPHVCALCQYIKIQIKVVEYLQFRSRLSSSLCRQSCASGWWRFTLHCPYMHHSSSEHCPYN